MEKKDNILKNIIYFSMVFSLVYIFGLAIKLNMDFLLQVFSVFLVSVTMKFLILNPIFILAFIIISFFSMILIYRFSPLFISNIFDMTILFLTNIFHNLKGGEIIASENILVFWGILIILLSLYTGIIIFKKKSIYLLLPVYIGFFLFYWYNYIDAANWMMMLFLSLFFILMTLNKYNLEVYRNDKLLIPDYKDLYPPWIKTGVLYALIIIILAISLPNTSNIIKWTWLQTKVYDTFPAVENWRSSSKFSRKYGLASYFDFSLTGYANIPSRLGGPVELHDTKIMTVYSDSPQYLRGNIKHRYNGEYWEIAASNSKDYRSGKDFSRLSKFHKKFYYEKSTIKITYNSFSSKTIFSPYKPSQVYFGDSSKVWVDEDYALIYTEGIYTGESYRVVAQVPLAYNKLMKSNISYRKNDIIGLSKYLQIPDDKITEATKQLTKDIVKDLDTDLEKAMAMEEYLRNNYEYSLNVSMVPKNHEFIDYFLFQEKKGYCTYYASTLAIMLRLEDIPSRYIEGYLAQELKEEGVYKVRQKNAHTWVEAFIEPIGWIRLEPTPAYPISPRYGEAIDEETSEVRPNDSNSILPNMDIWEDDNIKNLKDTLNGNSNYHRDSDISKTEGKRKEYFIIFLGILFSILPLRLLFTFLKLKYRDFKIEKLSDRKKIVYIYNDILKLTEAVGYPQKFGETHREYANRIYSSFYYFDDKGIKEITEIFVRNKYGNSPVLKNDLLEMKNFKNSLKVRIRYSLGILQYLKLYVKL